MKKFRNSIITAVGFLLLIGLATITNPRNGFGSGGASSSAPSTQTQNVNVVNTPTVSAQQTGTWNVGITGTPVVGLDPAGNTVRFDADNNTVKVDSSAPVAVRDLDNPGRHPFAAVCTINNNLGFPCTLANVPPGKRLVIEMVQLQLGGSGPELTVVTNNTTITYLFFEPSQLVRVYADPLSTVQVAGGQTGTKAAISGYLVDLP